MCSRIVVGGMGNQATVCADRSPPEADDAGIGAGDSDGGIG